MDEPLMDPSPAYRGAGTGYAEEGGDSFSKLAMPTTAAGGSSGADEGTGTQDLNLESIDYLPANNAPWRKHVTKQEKMKSNW